MATLNSIEIPSSASGTYESLTLPTAGTWFIKPRCQKYTLTGRLSEGADSLISQEGVGLNVKVSQADAPLTIYLQADCAENTTAKADYSDCFEVGAEGEGGGGGGASYTFSAPLAEAGGTVSLNVGSGLQVTGDNLSLDLSGNQEFANVKNSIPSLQTKESARFAFTSQKIFEKGKPIAGFESISNTPFFRIPAMCVSPTTGTIFVFSDYRNDPGDQVAIEIACARSTNGGYDWTYSKAVTREGNDAHSRVMDSTCLATRSGKILVLAGSWSQGTTNWTQVTSRDPNWKAILAVSTNDGVSWTQNTMQFTTQNPLPSDVNAFLGGVGAGVQLRDGRLVFPVQFTRSRGTVSAGMIWSSDDGATWNWTAGRIDGMSESMIFEDLEGNLICVGRKDPNNTPKARSSYFTTDNGATWTEYSKLHSRIPANGNAGCQGSSIYFVTQNGVPILLMTAVQNRKGGYNRDRITLYASNNSYGAIKEVFVLNYNSGDIERNTPFGGYSCLAYYKGADGERLFCVFEDGLGVRLTDLTPLIAELEVLFKSQNEISLNRASSYVADGLITEYSANNFHKNIWLENGNWDNLDVFNSRGEVSVDGSMVKFRNSRSSDTNYACSKVSDALHLLTNKEMTFDFDLFVPTTTNLSVSNYQCVFAFNGGGNDVNFSYGLLFHTTSSALQMNPVGYWGNSSTFNIPTELLGTKLHFTMVYTATSCNIYLNGNATPVFTNTFTSPSNWLDRVKKVWLGNAPTRDKICDFALGNFKVYGKALTPEEALQNYNASVNLGSITILDPNTTPSTTNIPTNSFVLIARR